MVCKSAIDLFSSVPASLDGSSSVSRSKFSISSHYTAPMNNCAFGLRFERWKWWASFIFPPPSGSQSELKVSPALPRGGWQAQIHLFPAPPAGAGASGKESRQIQTPQGEGQSTPHSWHVQLALQFMKHGQLPSWCFPSTNRKHQGRENLTKHPLPWKIWKPYTGPAAELLTWY